MPIIRTTTIIQGPIDRVFDLARSIDTHVATTSKTAEKAVAGRTRGLLGYGESVTWEAKHLGRKQRLKVQITEFDRPNMFVDEMVTGAFRSLRHVHRFKSIAPDQTEMTDEFVFRAPMGPLGIIAERAFLTGYLRKFVETRNQQLKQIAESERWQEFLPVTSMN